MAKDAKGHGSNARSGPAQPIPGHPYHGKTDAELHFIAKDAHAAAQAMQGHNSTAENKYRDQVNDASTVLGYRSRGGAMDIAAQHGIDTSHLDPEKYAKGLEDTYRAQHAPGGRNGYNPEAVNKAISNASRYQGKVSGREASMIHRLLKGRG
jgi:hypothetical protein